MAVQRSIIGRPRGVVRRIARPSVPTPREFCTHKEVDQNVYKICCPDKPFGTPWGQTCNYQLVAPGGTRPQESSPPRPIRMAPRGISLREGSPARKRLLQR